MNENLSLVENKKVTGIQPAVMREKDAIKYISSNRTDFRELVKSGAISYFHHLGKPGRIYFKEDLDAYLVSLKRHIMPESENPPMSRKGLET